MQSVSSQLESSLILKSHPPLVRQLLSPEAGNVINTKASEYLLKAPGLSRSEGNNSYTPYSGQSTRKAVSAVDPLLHQISESSVEKPKYWKSTGKQVKKVVKSQSQTATKKRQQKGEEYKDRLKHKIENRKSKRA
eukprot:gene27738-36559_t